MRKKIISLVCAGFMTMGLSACGSSSDYGESFDAFDSAIDLDYTKELIKTISSFGDDPATGYRSAGSPAETETAEYLKSEMEKIGLKNVTMEETTLDT